MTKLQSAIRLLLGGQLGAMRQRLRINIRRRRLRQANGGAFVYTLGTFPFVCMPEVPELEDVFLTGEFDQLELSLLRAWLEAGDVFVDVGANLGTYSFAARHRLGSAGLVVGIEASPELHSQLQASAALLGYADTTFVQCVVGDQLKEIDFYTARPGITTGEQSINPDPAFHSSYLPRRLQMLTLAEVFRRHSIGETPAVVKLDIEGAEELALRGAPPTWFSTAAPLWIVEINPKALARNGTDCSKVTEWFPTDCFERWLHPHYGSSGRRNLPVRRLTPDERFDDAQYYNLLAVPCDSARDRRRKRVLRILPK